MERYQRVNRPRQEAPIKENEVRITTQGLMRNYISYAITLLQDKRVSEIVLKAMGRAINKTVLLAEIVKRRVEGLHQNVVISSIDITDVWEPLEEGLVPIETTRHVSMITITLSKEELDVSSSGYQPPLAEKRRQPPADANYANNGPTGGVARGRGRGTGRGQGRGRGVPLTGGGGGYYNNSWEEAFNSGISRSRGRARGYRGSGRSYNSGYPQADTGRYEDGGYGNQELASWGRGWLVLGVEAKEEAEKVEVEGEVGADGLEMGWLFFYIKTPGCRGHFSNKRVTSGS